ncbi:MAG TPA: UDP-N-acetyl-D-glucosamine dehydrogenase, partial [Pseudomonadaceae bacterium]|nr:UDP-N-acetyl-D-glucosamine dehydrogenase [Pseudomonadaceae bacterium]
KAREYGIHTRFIELAGEVNNAMPQWVMEKIASALNERQLAIKGSKVLVLGIAYKKNVDDMRESPAVMLMELLRAKGALLCYSDPWVPVFPKMREHYFELASVELTAERLQEQDLVLLATNHDLFDYAFIRQHAALIVDTRGVYLEPEANVVKA